MNAAKLSDALADWMTNEGATSVYLELLNNVDGSYSWSASIVRDDHQPQSRAVRVFDTSQDHPTCFGALGELGFDHAPLADLAGDWGRLAGDL